MGLDFMRYSAVACLAMGGSSSQGPTSRCVYSSSMYYMVEQSFTRSHDDLSVCLCMACVLQRMREAIEMAYTYVVANLPGLVKCMGLVAPINPLYDRKKDLHIHAPFWSAQYDTEAFGVVSAVAMLAYAIAKPVKEGVGVFGFLNINGRMKGFLIDGGVINRCVGEGLNELVMAGDESMLTRDALEAVQAHDFTITFASALWQGLEYLFDLRATVSGE